MCVVMKLLCIVMMFVSRSIRTKNNFSKFAKNNYLLFSSYKHHHVRSKHEDCIIMLKK